VTVSLRRVSPQATQSDHGRFAVVDAALVRRKAVDAAANPRRREVHRLHAVDGETLHRMLNALQPGTYVRPHRHLTPPKAEVFVLLSGMLGFVAFDEAGRFGREDCLVLDPAKGTYAVDIPAGTWHAIVALAPDTVVFEAKPGPYAPASDKDFAPWAPAEGLPEAVAALMATEDRLRSLLDLPPRPWKSLPL
jgi:cupin fold WbuC family metalloprotein